MSANLPKPDILEIRSHARKADRAKTPTCGPLRNHSLSRLVNGTRELGIGAVRQIIGVTGLIFAAIFAASYWKLIHIGPAVENGVMICFVTTLLALTVVEWMIAKKTGA